MITVYLLIETPPTSVCTNDFDPQLLLETWPVLETQLLLEDIRYISCNCSILKTIEL